MSERELGAFARDRGRRAELQFAAMKSGSPEHGLRSIARMKSRLVDAGGSLSKFVNSPPTFGFRRAAARRWLTHVHQLDRSAASASR
jgi:hypothetical protein